MTARTPNAGSTAAARYEARLQRRSSEGGSPTWDDGRDAVCAGLERGGRPAERGGPAEGREGSVRERWLDGGRVGGGEDAVDDNVAGDRLRVVEPGADGSRGGGDGRRGAGGEGENVAHAHGACGRRGAVGVDVVTLGERDRVARGGGQSGEDVLRVGELVRKHEDGRVGGRADEDTVADLQVGHGHAGTRLERGRGGGGEADRVSIGRLCQARLLLVQARLTNEHVVRVLVELDIAGRARREHRGAPSENPRRVDSELVLGRKEDPVRPVRDGQRAAHHLARLSALVRIVTVFILLAQRGGETAAAVARVFVQLDGAGAGAFLVVAIVAAVPDLQVAGVKVILLSVNVNVLRAAPIAARKLPRRVVGVLRLVAVRLRQRRNREDCEGGKRGTREHHDAQGWGQRLPAERACEFREEERAGSEPQTPPASRHARVFKCGAKIGTGCFRRLGSRGVSARASAWHWANARGGDARSAHAAATGQLHATLRREECGAARGPSAEAAPTN